MRNHKIKEVLSWQLKQLKAVTLLTPSTLASVEGEKVDWGRLLSGASGAAEEFISVPHQVLHSLRLHLMLL